MLSKIRRRTRTALTIAFIFLMVPGVWWSIRHLIFMRFQSLGGKYLRQSLDQFRLSDHDDFFCNFHLADDRVAPELIQTSLDYFKKSKQLNPRDPYLNLQLGRVYCLLDDHENAQNHLLAYTLSQPRNPLGHLELGFLYERICILGQTGYLEGGSSLQNCADQAFLSKMIDEWKAAGTTAQEFLNRGEELSKPKYSRDSFFWFNRAVLLNPENKWIWNRIGIACRDVDRTKIDICQLFVDRNGGNLIPNSDFQFGLEGWGIVAKPTYKTDITTECDSGKQNICATIKVINKTTEFTGVFNQCLTLKPGKNFKFSAWIKVNAPHDSTWRPVYIQGVVDGEPRGIWPGTQQSSMDWTLWETNFSAPDYEDNLACFYPIRLKGVGEALFYNPTILEVEMPN